MKFLFFARIVLMDCGRVSKGTRGSVIGPIREGSSPPNIWFP
jgi:hypothetical protein